MTTFASLFVPAELREAVSGRAWLAAMLEAERALAVAGAQAGVVPAGAGKAIAAACDPAAFDFDELAEQGRAGGTVVEPLVRALRGAVDASAEPYVHFGATSQDIMDSAAMLVARRALSILLAELDRAIEACATIAARHRLTPLAGRTLLQQAVPTTFGLKAAGWLVELLDAADRLRAVERTRLAAQLGGAAGTLAPFGDDGPRVLDLFARELDLAVPTVPWHTNRVRIAELGAALGVAAGSAAKIGLDIALLAQTEVGEVREQDAGASSTMPQKRNPVGATLARAAARTAAAHVATLTGGLEQAHERSAGVWQAEWEALSGALAFTGAAAAAIAGSLEGLQVDAARMRANLDLTGGLVVAERIALLLAGRLGRQTAHEVVSEAARRAQDGNSFREELRADPRCDLTLDEIDSALDPVGYLGSAAALVDRALARYEGEEPA